MLKLVTTLALATTIFLPASAFAQRWMVTSKIDPLSDQASTIATVTAKDSTGQYTHNLELCLTNDAMLVDAAQSQPVVRMKYSVNGINPQSTTLRIRIDNETTRVVTWNRSETFTNVGSLGLARFNFSRSTLVKFYLISAYTLEGEDRSKIQSADLVIGNVLSKGLGSAELAQLDSEELAQIGISNDLANDLIEALNGAIYARRQAIFNIDIPNDSGERFDKDLRIASKASALQSELRLRIDLLKCLADAKQRIALSSLTDSKETVTYALDTNYKIFSEACRRAENQIRVELEKTQALQNPTHLFAGIIRQIKVSTNALKQRIEEAHKQREKEDQQRQRERIEEKEEAERREIEAKSRTTPSGELAASQPAIDPRRPRPRPTVVRTQKARPAIVSEDNGLIGYDPKWRSYDGYLRRLTETVQMQWERIIINRNVLAPSGTSVVVKFALNFEGKVTRIVNVDNHSTEDGARACVNSITDRAPYGPWTEDMNAMLGEEQVLTFAFRYQ